MSREYAIRAGGWDARYAVVRALVVHDKIAAALVDSNGDGGSMDLDEYFRGPDGQWVPGNSGGGAGDSATSWSPVMVTMWGRTDPGATVLVDYLDKTFELTGNEDGWWLFATPSLAEDAMPATRVDTMLEPADDPRAEKDCGLPRAHPDAELGWFAYSPHEGS